MTDLERTRRVQALKLADTLNMIGGGSVSEYAKSLSLRWANGEITGEQMKEALLEAHRKLAKQNSPPQA